MVRRGRGERGTEEIGKLYNNLARENFCCSMSLLPIVCRTKLSGQVQVQQAESIKKYLKDTLNYAGCRLRLRLPLPVNIYFWQMPL